MRSKILAGIAAITLAASSMLAASPASAQRWHHGGGHGGGYHHHYHGGGGGAFIGGLAAGAILGGALASRPYYGAYAYDGNAVAYCESRFKSYDPASGTYLGYDGYRHPCP
jgi:hypothetical protein